MHESEHQMHDLSSVLSTVKTIIFPNASLSSDSIIYSQTDINIRDNEKGNFPHIINSSKFYCKGLFPYIHIHVNAFYLSPKFKGMVRNTN